MIGKKAVPGGRVVDVRLDENQSDVEIIGHLDGADDMVRFRTGNECEVVVGTRGGKAVREAGGLLVGARRKIAAMAKKVGRSLLADSRPAPRVTVPRRVARRDSRQSPVQNPSKSA